MTSRTTTSTRTSSQGTDLTRALSTEELGKKGRMSWMGMKFENRSVSLDFCCFGLDAKEGARTDFDFGCLVLRSDSGRGERRAGGSGAERRGRWLSGRGRPHGRGRWSTSQTRQDLTPPLPQSDPSYSPFILPARNTVSLDLLLDLVAPSPLCQM